MEVCILYSGSRGNATFVKSGNTGILIDCGKSARALCLALRNAGYDISAVDAIFITHEHADHTSALEVLCKKHFIPVHAAGRSADVIKEKYRINTLVSHGEKYELTVGELKIKSFPVPHDSLGNVGYVIEDASSDRVGIVTDMGHVTDKIVSALSGCRRVIIESNHDVEMLKNGPYPKELQARILAPKGHLSNEDASLLACTLADGGCEVFALAHISADNNTPDIAYTETRRALDSSGHSDCALTVTYMDSPVFLPDGALDDGGYGKDISAEGALC